jgi:hypothetical protein
MGEGTRRRPRHAGVTGARGCRAGGQSARKLPRPAMVGAPAAADSLCTRGATSSRHHLNRANRECSVQVHR